MMVRQRGMGSAMKHAIFHGSGCQVTRHVVAAGGRRAARSASRAPHRVHKDAGWSCPASAPSCGWDAFLTLHQRIMRAAATEIDSMQRFVRNYGRILRGRAAVAERWNNSPVEGHINRLRTFDDRCMGRGVELVRTRL